MPPNVIEPTKKDQASMGRRQHATRCPNALGSLLHSILGFRVGEMVAPGSKSFDRKTHLCVEDIAVDNPTIQMW